MVFEIFKLHSCQIQTFITHSTVPEAHKYKQNKTGTTDTDFKCIKRQKQELASES